MPELGALVVPVAIWLGFAYCAAPGAVNAESLRRGLTHGPRAALVLQSGSIVGDLIWASLALAGLALLLQDDRLRVLLGLAGAILLLWFAWGALRSAWRPDPTGEPPAHTAAGSFAAGVAMATVNPWGPIFWLGIGAGLGVGAGATGGGGADAIPGVGMGVATGIGGALAFLASFFAGALAWAIAVALLVALARRLPVRRILRGVDLVVGAAFGWFALSLLLTTLEVARGL